MPFVNLLHGKYGVAISSKDGVVQAIDSDIGKFEASIRDESHQRMRVIETHPCTI